MNPILKNITDLGLLFQALAQTREFVKTHSWIWGYIIGAIVLNFVVFVIILGLIWWLLISVFGYSMSVAGIDTNSLVEGIARVLFWIVALIISMISFSIMSSVVNAPIYGALADRILTEDFEGLAPTTAIPWYSAMSYTLVSEFKKLVLNTAIFAVTLLINIVPVIGQVLFVVVNLAQLIVITGLDLFDPILMHKKLSFRKKITLFNQSTFLYWPFLIIAGLLSAIPVVNIFFIPFLQIIAIFIYTKRPLHSEYSEYSDSLSSFSNSSKNKDQIIDIDYKSIR